MVAASSSVDAVPRQMSWAERARGTNARPPSLDSSKGTSPAPSNASTTLSSTFSNPLSDSIRSTSSNVHTNGISGSHHRSGSDSATTAPLALVSNDTTAVDETSSPTKSPVVNVWKERMAAAAQHKPKPASVAAPTPIQASSVPVAASSSTSPTLKPHEKASKPAGRGRPVAPSLPPPPALTDTTNWPQPLDAEKSKAVEESAQKLRADDPSPSGASSKSSNGQDQSKAKAKTKWVPIEADITFDAPLPTRYLKDGEKNRSNARSHSRDTQASRSSRGNEDRERRGPARSDQPLQVATGLPGLSAPPEAGPKGSSPQMNLPTSLPAKPLAGDLPPTAIGPNGMYPMHASSPRLNGIPGSPNGATLSPTLPSLPLSRSMSASSSTRGGSGPTSRSEQPSIRAESSAFVPSNRGGFNANRGRGGNGRGGPPRNNDSTRGGNQSNYSRGGSRGNGGPRGGGRVNGAFSNGPAGAGPHQMMPPNGMPFYEGSFAPYGYMPPMPFAPGAQPFANQPGQPFSMLPLMNSLPPAPFKLDYNPPLDPTRFYLLGQIEFYISPDNLAKDLFLRQQMDTEGWIEMKTVLTFKRIQALTTSLELLRETIMLSPLMDVDYAAYKFRPKNDWARWIMPDAKPAAPYQAPPVMNGIASSLEHDEANASASEDGTGTGTTGGTGTGLTSPSLSSASHEEETSVKQEAVETA